MKRIYTLFSCGTCCKILDQLGEKKGVEIINIKESNIDENTLDWLKEKAGSYEALFSKRAMKFRGMDLNEMTLTEADYRKYMLQEYTFLKRPFIIDGEHVFIGNAKKDVELAVTHFKS